MNGMITRSPGSTVALYLPSRSTSAALVRADDADARCRDDEQQERDDGGGDDERDHAARLLWSGRAAPAPTIRRVPSTREDVHRWHRPRSPCRRRSRPATPRARPGPGRSRAVPAGIVSRTTPPADLAAASRRRRGSPAWHSSRRPIGTSATSASAVTTTNAAHSMPTLDAREGEDRRPRPRRWRTRS